MMLNLMQGTYGKIASDEGVEIVISPGGLWPMNTDLSLPVKNNNTIALDWHKRWIEKGLRVEHSLYRCFVFASGTY